MNKSEIKDYRKILEKEFTNKDLEIETTLTYISVGALGFFITMNEKFIQLQTAEYKSILILSLLFLFSSFVLILYRKSRTSKSDLDLMEFIDNMNPDNEDDDNKIFKLWERSHKDLNCIRKVIYICLALGVGLQGIFLILNI